METAGETVEASGNTADNLTLAIIFSFEESWHIGRVRDETTPGAGVLQDKLIFPGGLPSGGGGGGGPGPGTAGGRGNAFTRAIHIEPIHLRGRQPDEVAEIIRKRAADMAILAEAMTIANIQFREALDSISTAKTASDQSPQ